MPNTRELAQIIDRETGDVNNLRDKKLADATAQQQSGSASTDSVVMKTTGGEYVEIARDSFVGAIKGVMDGLIKGNSYTTLGANDPIAAFNSNALGGITPANLASVLGVLDVPITFETPAVKEKVVAAFGGVSGGTYGTVPGFRGEITYRQALGITMFPSIFYGSDISGSFNEFKYFRNVRAFDVGTFYGSALASVIVPEGVTSLPYNMFREIQGFYVELPSTLASINMYGFYGGSATIRLYATMPPNINQSQNPGIVKIYVPQSALSAYQQHAEWSKYGNIIEGF